MCVCGLVCLCALPPSPKMARTTVSFRFKTVPHVVSLFGWWVDFFKENAKRKRNYTPPHPNSHGCVARGFLFVSFFGTIRWLGVEQAISTWLRCTAPWGEKLLPTITFDE